MKLQLSTWPEVEAYLRRSTAILVPVGSTEQHGPTGFIGTDALCPQLLADGLSQRCGALVAPTLPIGMAQHHMAFPGTITLRPTTLIAVVRDVVESLAHHGFDRFYVLNGHGGNVATLTAAFSEILAQASLRSAPQNRPPLRFRLRNWWDTPGVQALTRDLFGDAEGRHATCSELSLTYQAFPDHVKRAELTPRLAPVGPIYDAEDYRRRFPDGRIGSDPSLASVEAGRRLYETALAGLEQDWQAFMAEG